MKKLLSLVSLLVLCICSISTASGPLQKSYQQDWGVSLGSGDSITCIAHYIPDSAPNMPGDLVFDDAPVFADDGSYEYYNEGNPDGWDVAIADDNKSVWLYGPRQTNDQGYSNWWWIYELSFAWTGQEGEDEPLYFDTALYDGGEGSEPVQLWGASGNETDGFSDTEPPYASQEYIDNNYLNPAPEPATLLMLTGGIWFAARRKRG